MKKYLFSLFLLFPLLSVIAQEKGILLKQKDTEKTDYLVEHKRIKVVTTEGKSFYGRFSIIDNNTISINNTLIPLTSIEKIKRKSLVSTIATPLVCVVGVYLVLGGTAVVALGGRSFALYGVGLISSGFTLPVVALVSNKHSKSRWNYAIENIPNQ